MRSDFWSHFMSGPCGPRSHACHGRGRPMPRRERHREAADEMDDDFRGGGFGVRRQLRFLAHKLDLDERQVAELARILDALKTERAEAEADRSRTLSAFAYPLSAEAFDAASAAEGGELRVSSAQRLREAV